ncbi:hypothetical protein BDK51DRAFT_27933 [Blyttiomyces helicus]|uniref:Uncharacterized protein n=1 Tax=Blyttiomyces helicus TaxID=388810 RepID=A0A4P9WFP2_9FUNG|nr:hypothetical protein BDK51DRAFT_27933 [Blyttiomyces helicus]|eukprot:RKO91591.1 hypothetical protein BDK51DRAFT_27933 [Blyttiomyces helicus]
MQAFVPLLLLLAAVAVGAQAPEHNLTGLSLISCPAINGRNDALFLYGCDQPTGVWSYDIPTSEWTQLATTQPHYNATLAEYISAAYASSPSPDGSSTKFALDPQNVSAPGVWAPVPPAQPPSTLWRSARFAIGDSLFFVGGSANITALTNATQTNTTDTGEWTEGPHFSNNVHGGLFLVIGRGEGGGTWQQTIVMLGGNGNPQPGMEVYTFDPQDGDSPEWVERAVTVASGSVAPTSLSEVTCAAVGSVLFVFSEKDRTNFAATRQDSSATRLRPAYGDFTPDAEYRPASPVATLRPTSSVGTLRPSRAARVRWTTSSPTSHRDASTTVDRLSESPAMAPRTRIPIYHGIAEFEPTGSSEIARHIGDEILIRIQSARAAAFARAAALVLLLLLAVVAVDALPPSRDLAGLNLVSGPTINGDQDALILYGGGQPTAYASAALCFNNTIYDTLPDGTFTKFALDPNNIYETVRGEWTEGPQFNHSVSNAAGASVEFGYAYGGLATITPPTFYGDMNAVFLSSDSLFLESSPLPRQQACLANWYG